MNTQKIFDLNKLRCEVAMQQALQDWQPQPKTYGFECPSTARRKSKVKSQKSKSLCCQLFPDCEWYLYLRCAVLGAIPLGL